MLSLLRTPLVAAAALLCWQHTAPARTATECGTVILPTGLGASSAAGTVGSLSPLLNTSVYDHEVIEQFYRPLVWIDRHGEPDYTRSIAQSVDTPDNGLTFVVTLHDWRWSDGRSITPADLVFTLDLIRRLGPGYVWYGTGGVPNLLAGWRIVGPHAVELRMTRKVNPRWFVSLGLGNNFYPLPEHVYRGLDLLELRRRQTDPSLFAVGDGPFLLKEFALGRHVVLVPNPLYGGHHPSIRRLVISFPFGNTSLEQLRAGQLDAASVPFMLADFVRRLPGVRVLQTPPATVYGEGIINFHSKHAPFLADDAVRRAIVRGIDQTEINALVFRGRSSTNHGPVPASLAALQSDEAHRNYPALSFDPEAAVRLLRDDGWTRGADGIFGRDGRRLSVSILTSSESPAGVMLAQVIQRDLARIGIEVQLQLVGFNQLLATLDGNGHDWDIVALNWTVETYPDVHDFFGSDGTQNYGGFRDPTMDRLTDDEMFGTGDQPLHAVQDYAASRIPYLYLPSGTPNVLVRDGIDHMDQFLSPNGMWSGELLDLSGPLGCPVAAIQPERHDAAHG